jgi:hypothetical protein
MDFAKHGLLSNVSCSPFGSPWKVSNIEPKGSPVKLGNSKRKFNIPSEEEIPSSSTESSDDESHSSVTSESDYSDVIEEQQNQEMISFRRSSLLRTRKLLNWEPRIYLGILPERISFLTLLSNKLSCDQDMFITAHDAVCLIFRKIRLNESFTILGYEFEISSREASRIFIRYAAFIADHMHEIIFWPKHDSLKRALPISFRKNYSKIQSIIDCFEVEIQKPSDPVNQALTWSEYEGCNTLKYMVSVTPGGLISFVSTGYGEGTTDEVVASQSKYLDLLPTGCYVMADRGFKRIEPFLASKQCFLVRPSSVKTGTISRLKMKSLIVEKYLAYESM